MRVNVSIVIIRTVDGCSVAIIEELEAVYVLGVWNS
jgi:hypothetical protein